MAEADVLVAVLAAGRASRFGGGKLDADCAGRPLGRYVLDAAQAAGLPAGVVVTGPEGCWFGEGWDCLINPDPAAGLASSLAITAQLAIERGARALLLLLADMPLISPAFLRDLSRTPAPAATRYPGGQPGAPALFGAGMLPDLVRLTGDRGAASLLNSQPDLTLLDPPPQMLFDVDTVEDLAQAATIIAAGTRLQP
ncbi:NTP transferase domain-containing protein [Altererythrobacter xixiisoli]|uniref:NTP transferase domain-containing protein n=1 Tax=Croceibacterium xixiisoli TaxID=1476466 RepID=A0A6I4TWZ6_9SPHN|nr:nucleotidyltransferase family protein [Croceibacterium xixiisoli]MXO99168.1 NTP transferase domain-containing protein [Croceibacterium xixiisoli]